MMGRASAFGGWRPRSHARSSAGGHYRKARTAIAVAVAARPGLRQVAVHQMSPREVGCGRGHSPIGSGPKEAAPTSQARVVRQPPSSSSIVDRPLEPALQPGRAAARPVRPRHHHPGHGRRRTSRGDRRAAASAAYRVLARKYRPQTLRGPRSARSRWCARSPTPSRPAASPRPSC